MGQIKRRRASGKIRAASKLLIWILGPVLLSLGGCFKRPSSHPNVLVLAVEHLSPEDGVCTENVQTGVQSGLDLLCETAVELDSVRAPSQWAVPSLAALLFGLPPDKLRVQTNKDYVTADFESFPEKASAKGWSTSFFGSSPLFMRRSGLAQGFEAFEESPQVEVQSWGRRADQVVQNFLRWQSDQNGSAFYSVLTFSDLNFPWVKSSSLSGQERPRSVEGRVEALYDSWLVLFRAMKERRIWDDTWIVVVGLQGRGDDLDQVRTMGLVKPAKNSQLRELKERTFSIDELSTILHQALFQTPAPEEPRPESSGAPKLVDNDNAGAFWLSPKSSKTRGDVLKEKLVSQPALLPWLLLELLDQNRSSDFIRLADHERLPDAAPFWDRVLKNKRDQILQDPCLRMIDLKIFEGGGSKTCDSPTLLSLQEWMRQSESGSDDAHLREARQRTLREWHELRSLRRIQMINFALGEVFPFSLTIGNEILRTEMALRLPDQQAAKSWLDQTEQSLAEAGE